MDNNLWVVIAVLFLPVGFCLCFVLAYLGTHIRRINNDCPTALKAAWLDANSDNSWNIR